MALSQTTTRGLILTLVHGTWGRGFWPTPYNPKKPRWFEPGSRFRRDLEKSLGELHVSNFTTEEFHWSGANSIKERAEAGRLLSIRLKEQRVDHPKAAQVLICHSHGGNVALDVANWAEKGDLRHLSVVTLATPFLELFPPSPDEPNFERLWLFAGYLIALNYLPYRFPEMDLRLGFVLLVLLIAPAFLLGWYDLRIFKRRRRGGITSVDLLCLAAQHRSFVDAEIPLFVVRGIDDEASLALAAGGIGSWLSRQMRSRSVALWLRLHPKRVFIPLVIMAFSGIALGWSLAESLARLLFPYMLLVSVGLGTIIFVLTVFAVLCTTVFGREMLGFHQVEVNFNSVPDAVQNITVKTLKRRGQITDLLRHYIYDEPACAWQVALWIARRKWQMDRESPANDLSAP